MWTNRTKQPPLWLANWRTFLLRLMMLEFNILKTMRKLVKLGLRPRAWLSSSGMADLKEATAGDPKAKSFTKDLHPSGVPEVRQCSRPVLEVQEVRSKVPVAPRTRGLGSVLTKVLQLVGAAIAILGNDPSPNGSDKAQGQTDHAQARGHQEQSSSPAFSRQLIDETSPLLSGPGRFVGGDGLSKQEWEDIMESAAHDQVDSDHPDGSRTMGLVTPPPEHQHQCDYWEKDKNKYIRHHIMPRLLLYTTHDISSPFPKRTLLPECQAEVHYEDGTFETTTYDWTDNQATQLQKPWAAIQNAHNQSTHLLAAAARRALRNTVRQTHHVFNAEYALVSHAVDEHTLLQ